MVRRMVHYMVHYMVHCVVNRMVNCIVHSAVHLVDDLAQPRGTLRFSAHPRLTIHPTPQALLGAMNHAAVLAGEQEGGETEVGPRRALLLTTDNLPLTTYHSPLTTHHSPLTTHHSPLTTYPVHLTTYRLPLTAHCPLRTAHYPLRRGRHCLPLHTAQVFTARLRKSMHRCMVSGKGTR
eukprot:scaffold5736_cov58-Phaeocystis_antarctica.AAC.1